MAAVVLLAFGLVGFAGCGASSHVGADGGSPCQVNGCLDALAETSFPDVPLTKDVVEEPDAGPSCASACEKRTAFKGCPDPGCAGECSRQELLCTGAIALAIYQAYLSCETTAHYTCSTTSPPLPVTSDCDASASAAASACSPDSGAGDAGCTMTGSASACAACCGSMHTEGADTYGVALTHCACSSPGICITPCSATECNAIVPPSGSACAKCLAEAIGPDGGCEQTLSADCAADPDCVAYETCLTTSGCSKKK
jgi:hypothetical protein